MWWVLGRGKFYRAFNAIYSKVYRSHENVIVTLMRSYCLPVLLYGLEAVSLNATSNNSLDPAN